jgi:peptidoglycan/xylan/chitin deacetylase (PgdA/CDA1 family)
MTSTSRKIRRRIKTTLTPYTRMISRVETGGEPLVALTFDDGPHPVYTPKVLQVLERFEAKATFFMIGEAANEYFDVVQQVLDAGHEIGNHTWSHQSLPSISIVERNGQIKKGRDALEPFGSRLFRPPFGHHSFASQCWLKMWGYEAIGWDVDGRDWGGDSAEPIAKRITRDLQPGSIVLLHDALAEYIEPAYADREPTIEALEHVLKVTRSSYEFVTISELLNIGQAVRDVHWVEAPSGFLNGLHRNSVPTGYLPAPQDAEANRRSLLI